MLLSKSKTNKNGDHKNVSLFKEDWLFFNSFRLLFTPSYAFQSSSKTSALGEIISPYSLLSCSHLLLPWLTSPSLLHCTRWQEVFSIHFEKHKERGDLHSSPTPYFISLEYKYTLWEMVQERKTSPWGGLLYSNTEIPSGVTDELVVGASFISPSHAWFPDWLKSVILCTLVTPSAPSHWNMLGLCEGQDASARELMPTGTAQHRRWMRAGNAPCFLHMWVGQVWYIPYAPPWRGLSPTSSLQYPVHKQPFSILPHFSSQCFQGSHTKQATQISGSVSRENQSRIVILPETSHSFSFIILLHRTNPSVPTP